MSWKFMKPHILYRRVCPSGPSRFARIIWQAMNSGSCHQPPRISWRLKTNELRLTKVLFGYPRSKVWYCIIGIIRPWIRVPDSTTRIRFRKDRWSFVYFPFTPPEIFHIDILKSPCIWKPEMQHFLLLNFGCVVLRMFFFPMDCPKKNRRPREVAEWLWENAAHSLAEVHQQKEPSSMLEQNDGKVWSKQAPMNFTNGLMVFTNRPV